MNVTATVKTKPIQIVIVPSEAYEKNTWNVAPTPDFVFRGFSKAITASEVGGPFAALEMRALLAEPSTAHVEAIAPNVARRLLQKGSVDQYAEQARELDAKDALFEIRRLTGYTWEEIAELVSVDRRTLYNWVQGGRIRRNNNETLREVLVVLRSIDPGDDREMRKQLDRKNAAGERVFELIADGRYQAARMIPGIGRPSLRTSWTPVDPSVSLDLGPDELTVPHDEIAEEPAFGGIAVNKSRRRRSKRI